MTPSAGDEVPEPSARVRPYLRETTPEPVPEPEAATGWPAPGSAPPGGPRPFVLTAGRVDSADPAIGLETQVTLRLGGVAWTAPPLATLAPELQAIVDLCVVPVSVAEISARLRLHLGVTRVLVGDLSAAGHLDVHTADVADPYDPDTILRVIHGLRAIS
ncbi:DUF742 domain-containing protein [Polymorphospora rubra]|uniref:DUF742 domain-containing protein n=1 Tax=Polymorphospora rubra TaxID=338584 RepID=A0A810N3I2_9ACTN|nr:DUF742 domain-containing protein [Polymorphospora rubra]BCJ66065.1 hypothetical protein Prubr_30860 [Polymorphospora rubra]